MQIWHFRNNIVAEAKKLEYLHRTTLQTDEEIRQIFSIWVAGIRPVDQGIILNTSLEQVLKLNIHNKEDWINIWFLQ